MSASAKHDPQKERRELVKIALRLPLCLLTISPLIVTSLPGHETDADSKAQGEWWWPLVEWITDEARHEGIEARHYGLHFLLDCVVGRLRVHQAAAKAAAGATPDQVLATLWEEGDTLSTWPRSDVATPDELVQIGTVLRPTVEEIIDRGVLTEQIHVWLSRAERMPPLFPPFNWEYLQSLGRIGGCILEPRFHQMLDFVAAVDQAAFEGGLLGRLHPAVLLGLLTLQDTSDDRLLELLGHPELSVVAVAFMKVLRRFQSDQVGNREARDVCSRLRRESNRPEAREEWLHLKEEVNQSRGRQNRQIKRMEEILARRITELSLLVLDGLGRITRSDAITSALVRAAVASEGSALASLVQRVIDDAKTSESWEQSEQLAPAVWEKDPGLHDKIAQSCLEWWKFKGPLDPQSSVPAPPLRLLVAGLIAEGRRSPDSFWAALRDSREQAFDLAQGRYTGLRHFALDENIRRELAASGLVCEDAERRTRLWHEQASWLLRMIPIAPQMPPYLLDTLAGHLLRQIDPSGEEETDRGVELLTAAIESKDFTHSWSLWLPLDQPKREILLRKTHEQRLHVHVPFLVGTVRTGTNVFQNLLACLLEIPCAECRHQVFQRLAGLRGGPFRAAAQAALDAKSRPLELALRSLLGSPLLNTDYSRLRDALVSAARLIDTSVDINAIVSECIWAREMEQLGLADRTQFIEMDTIG